MTAAKCGSTWVFQSERAGELVEGENPRTRAAPEENAALRADDHLVVGHRRRDAGFVEEDRRSRPGMLAVHLTAPVFLSTAYRLPAQSGA